MPQVTLDLVSLDNKPLVGLSRRFEGSGGTIGRDAGNTLALPDAHRRVSRLHAAISFPGGVPTITNSSSVLPIGVDGRQLESGQAMPLLPGMSLDIGPYVLMVRPVELPTQPGPVPQVAAPESVDDPLAALLGSSAPAASRQAVGMPAFAQDPFAALGRATADQGVDVRSQPPQPASPSPPAAAAAVIPEDFNPFDLPSASARNSADPLSSMLGASAEPAAHALTQGEESIDALFAPAGAQIGDSSLNGNVPVAGLFGAVPGEPSPLLGPSDPNDPLALFGGPSRGPDRLAKPMRDDLAEIGGAYEPPRALDPAFSPAPAAQSPAPRPLARSNPLEPPESAPCPADALTRAFLAGAGLPPSALPQGLTPEVMAVVGSLLRSATAGAIEMLSVRANIKREVRANVTIISSEANNPLKFLPDAESVLQQLLGKRMRGFMGADEAMKDAFNDLRAHEMGVMAGTRAALTSVLGKFDPTVLGERLIGGSLLEKALPAMRKTKLWDLYLERYAQIRREVEDDFQSVFGKAFVAAYERETERMKARPSASRPDEQH